MKRYEFFDHTADIGIHIFGRCREELFENAGYALFDIITDISKVAEKERHTVILHRDCFDELLVEWLGRLLFLHVTDLLLFRGFHIIKLDEQNLSAEVRGEHFNDYIHSLKAEVKAVTYHNLKIWKENELWEATVVLDI
jgi:SHS2 domain-containing protein